MRITYTLGTLFFIFISPYWLYVPLIAIGIVIFPFYLEAIGLALAADIFYGHLFFTPIAAIIIVFAIPLREHLRFNA